MVLIAIFDGDGKPLGQCDARCYGAEKSTRESRRCVCRGLNYGVGLGRAQDNTREHAIEWEDAARARHGRAVRAVLHLTVRTTPLWTITEIAAA